MSKLCFEGITPTIEGENAQNLKKWVLPLLIVIGHYGYKSSFGANKITLYFPVPFLWKRPFREEKVHDKLTPKIVFFGQKLPCWRFFVFIFLPIKCEGVLPLYIKKFLVCSTPTPVKLYISNYVPIFFNPPGNTWKVIFTCSLVSAVKLKLSCVLDSVWVPRPICPIKKKKRCRIFPGFVGFFLELSDISWSCRIYF